MNGEAERGATSSAFRKLLFPLLFLFALLTSKISPAYIVGGALVLIWLLDMRARKRWASSLRSPLFALAALLAALTALSTIFSRDPAASVRHLAGVGVLLVLPLTIDVVDDARKARLVFLALGFSGIVIGAIGCWQFAHGADDLENRITGTLSSWMTLSGLTMIAGCLGIGILLEERGSRRWIGLAAVVPLTAMVLTFTRNAYVGTLAALVVYLSIRRPRGLLLLIPVVLAVFFVVPPPIRARIVSIASVEERTNRDRIAMARAGVKMIRDHPLFGVGPEMVKPYYTLYREADAPQWRVPHLHDNALQIAAANGILAAVAYLALMALFFARTVYALSREKDPERAALFSGALLAGVALFVAGFFEYNFGDTEVEMATLIVMAVPFSKAFQTGGARRTT